MRHIATEVHEVWSVCLCLFVGYTGQPCKMAEPIEMPFGADSCGPEELYVLDGGQPSR